MKGKDCGKDERPDREETDITHFAGIIVDALDCAGLLPKDGIGLAKEIIIEEIHAIRAVDKAWKFGRE